MIPVYRNEKAVTLTHAGIKEALSKVPNHDYEFIFVDDGSDDGSLAELLEIRKGDPKVKVITFTRNFGQIPAILAGFREATGDAVINVSADLQDPAELIPQMVQSWEAGNEVVICYRTNRDDGLMSSVFSRITWGIVKLSYPEMPSGGFDYVLLDRKALDAFNGIDARNRGFQGDILWFGYRTSFIPYVRKKRTIGRSQYSLPRKIKNFIDGVLDASYLPIRLCSALGIATAGFGALWSATIVWSWYFHRTPFTGWAPTMIAILMVGGMNMFMLGIMGEYVWRVYAEVRKKPNYVIRTIWK